jgi:hypothetical protein
VADLLVYVQLVGVANEWTAELLLVGACKVAAVVNVLRQVLLLALPIAPEIPVWAEGRRLRQLCQKELVGFGLCLQVSNALAASGTRRLSAGRQACQARCTEVMLAWCDHGLHENAIADATNKWRHLRHFGSTMLVRFNTLVQ